MTMRTNISQGRNDLTPHEKQAVVPALNIFITLDEWCN